MKLSVVIPVYNGVKFIEKSYQSVLDQNLDDYELVYINNNSTDGSVELIKALQTEDSTIKLYHQPIQGEAPARNMGIAMAKGDYFYQLDVDDEILPGALKKMVAVLDSNPNLEAVFGKMYKSDKRISELQFPLDETNKVEFKEAPYWGLRWFSSLKDVVGPPAFMFRKKVFENIGLYNEELKTIGCDTAMDINLGMTSNIAFLDTFIYLYFRHEASLVEDVKRKLPRAFMIWPRLVKEHLPFSFTYEVPKRFKELLYRQLFQSMGRQVYFTQGFQNRYHLLKTLEREVTPLKLPFLIRTYLIILVVLPFSILHKIYSYKLVPYTMKHIKLADFE